MEKDKRCSRCGTVNEQEYIYCKNCGSQLQVQKNSSSQNTHYTPINYNSSNIGSVTDYSEIEPEINGVDTKKVAAYVGTKNREQIMGRFIIAHKTGKRVTGFNWIVFITGTILAFPFASSWFFYRKMYKVGALLCAISLALTIIVTAVNFSEDSKYLRNEYSKVKDYSTERILEYEAEAIPEPTTADTADAVVKFCIAVFLSINAWNIYYKQSTNRIKKLELSNFPNNNQFYQLAGLPSSAAAILIPLGVRLVESLITCAPAISLIFSGADIDKVMLLLL